MDPVTAQAAARGARIAGRKLRSPFGPVGVRVFGGRMGTLNIAGTTTFHVACEVPTEFDAVQIIVANTAARLSYATINMAVAALPSAADLNGSAEPWTIVYSGGPSRARMNQANSGGTNRVRYTATDIAQLSSVARSDGGTKPILAMRVIFGPTATLPVVGNGTDSFTNWATRSTGNLWAMRHQAVLAATPGNYANFTSTTNQSQSPIVGYRFWSRGRVVNVMNVGDSIDDGRGTYLGAGYGELVCDSLSTVGGLTFMQANLGWSSQAASTYLTRAMDALRSPVVRPDILMIPSMSPNEGTPLTVGQFRTRANWLAKVIDECRRLGVVPVIRTMLPCSAAVNDWNASDALRIADNARVVALRDRDVLVADVAPLFETVLDGDGQMGINPALTNDGIHPNDAGLALMAAELAPLVAKGASIR